MPVRLASRSRSMANDVRCSSWFVWWMPRDLRRLTSSSVIPGRYSRVRYTTTKGYALPALRIIAKPRRHWSKHTLDQTRLATRESIPGEQSGLEIGIGRRARRSYGFDEVALVPGGVTP